MKKIHLANDNNKLHCSIFLHICLYGGVDAWPVDQGYEVYVRGQFPPHKGGARRAGGYLGEAKILRKQVSTIGKLNESVAGIATGFSLQVLKAELSSQAVPGFPITNDSRIHVITFKYLKYGKDHPLSHARPGAYNQRQLWNTKETQKESHTSVNA